MNTRSGGGDSLTGAYLSLGAGARAVGWPDAAEFLPREAAEYLYRLHTGVDPGSYVQPEIALIRQAQTVSYQVEPGALGSAVLEAGEQLKVLGSGSAALVGMDRLGRIWHGRLEEELTSVDPRYPLVCVPTMPAWPRKSWPRRNGWWWRIWGSSASTATGSCSCRSSGRWPVR